MTPDRAPLQVSAAGLSRLVDRGVARGQPPHRPGAARPPARRPPEPLAPCQVLRRPPARGARPDPRGHPAGGRCPRRRGATTSSTSARRPSGSRATSPAPRHVSKSYIEQQIEAAAPDRDTPVVLYCAGGVRSLFAAQTLAEMGYTDVASMRGGFQAWKGAGLEFETARRPDRRAEAALQPPPAHPRGRRRPARRSCSARRCCSSAPAGSARRPRSTSPRPASGTIGIVDFDVVDCQQPPAPDHPHDRPGRASGRSSRRADRSTRSTPTSRSSPTRRCSIAANVERLIAGYDVILDGTDTFETRYIAQRRGGRGRHPGRPRHRSSGSRAS